MIPRLIMMKLPTTRRVMMVVAKPDTARPWNHAINASAPTTKPRPRVSTPRTVTICSGALVKDTMAVVARPTSLHSDHLPSPSARAPTSNGTLT